MKRRYWLAPPLFAIVGYLSGDAVLPAKPAAETPAANAGARLPRPQLTVEQALEAYSEEMPGFREDYTPLEEEGLKQLILNVRELAGRLKREDEDFEATSEYLQFQFHDLINVLTERRKGEAYEWILQNAPELRLLAMDAWAQVEPGPAWQAIISSKIRPPCDIYTVTMILRAKAKARDSGLRQACMEVPWELFRYCDFEEMPFRAEYIRTVHELSIEYGDDPTPWIESGAARALAEQGMPIGGFFEAWSRKEPVAALQAWSEWPATAASDYEIVGIFTAKQEQAAELIAAIQGFTPEQRERAAKGISSYLQLNPHQADFFEAFFPALGLPLKSK